jgi:opacity protein-like surface antigen
MSGDLIMFAKWRALYLSAVALAGFSVASVASAADLDAVGYEPVVEAQPVEVGSGWYLRGDLGYNISSKTGLTARDQFGNSVSESFDLDKNFVPSVGIGYQFTDYLRADVTGSYSKQDLDGFPAEARIWDMMANGYVDLGNFAGFTPYLGGGLGFANVRYSFDTGSGDFKSDDDYRFAWALMAGVGIDVASNIKLDLGYRYGVISSGDVISGNGITISDKDIKSHQLRAGIRFTTW